MENSNKRSKDVCAEQTGSIQFFGSQAAELFSRELKESVQGAMANNYVSTATDRFPKGFVKASIPGHPWDDTCWTRDCGLFLREAAMWGYLEEAVCISKFLLSQVQKNHEGFFTYPMFFKGFEKGWGYEMDGTADIISGLARLWQRLPENHSHKDEIYSFLFNDASPLAYIQKKLDEKPLIAGSGEFGGGWCVPGEWYNVVQNSLIRQALLACAEIDEECRKKEQAESLRRSSAILLDNMMQYLTDLEDGSWIFCIHPHSMKLEGAALNEPHAKATASINGAGSSYADAEGLEPIADKWAGTKNTQITLHKTYNQYAIRKEQFEKFGMCTFVDVNASLPLEGLTSWLSYCDCYAAQVMALLDETALLDRVLNWIAATTYMGGSPTKEFIEALSRGEANVDDVNEVSTFWFTERNFSPEYDGEKDIGCGKLNLVNVAEPMKLARVMLGVDGRYSDRVKLVPRLPDSWNGVQANHWLMKTENGLVYVDMRFEKKSVGEYEMTLKIEDGKTIPLISIRFPDGSRQECVEASGSLVFQRKS